jgi:hypothetical protein
MARDSYPFPLNVTDTDIEKVAGKGATLGMEREGPDGKRYLLVRNAASSGVSSATTQIVGFKASTAFTVEPAGANGQCDGIHSVGCVPAASGYFWIQVGGAASLTGTQTKNSFVGSLGAGVGGDLTPDYDLAAVATYAGYIGIAIEDASTTGLVWIRPGFITI